MCLGVPGQIVEITSVEHQLAVVDVEGVQRTVNVSLIVDAGVAVGDWVLIHLGFAMSKLDEEEARANLAFLAAMRDPFSDEMDALFASPVEELPPTAAARHTVLPRP